MSKVLIFAFDITDCDKYVEQLLLNFISAHRQPQVGMAMFNTTDRTILNVRDIVNAMCGAPVALVNYVLNSEVEQERVRNQPTDPDAKR